LKTQHGNLEIYWGWLSFKQNLEEFLDLNRNPSIHTVPRSPDCWVYLHERKTEPFTANSHPLKSKPRCSPLPNYQSIDWSTEIASRWSKFPIHRTVSSQRKQDPRNPKRFTHRDLIATCKATIWRFRTTHFPPHRWAGTSTTGINHTRSRRIYAEHIQRIAAPQRRSSQQPTDHWRGKREKGRRKPYPASTSKFLASTLRKDPDPIPPPPPSPPPPPLAIARIISLLVCRRS
jgi:hypothetical protein